MSYPDWWCCWERQYYCCKVFSQYKVWLGTNYTDIVVWKRPELTRLEYGYWHMIRVAVMLLLSICYPYVYFHQHKSLLTCHIQTDGVVKRGSDVAVVFATHTCILINTNHYIWLEHLEVICLMAQDRAKCRELTRSIQEAGESSISENTEASLQ